MASTRWKPSVGEALDQRRLVSVATKFALVLQPVARETLAQNDVGHQRRSCLGKRCAELESLDGVLAQLVLLHLAARRHADGVEILDDGQIARHAEIGAVPLHEFDQLGLGRAHRLERDEGRAHLAEPRVRHAHDLRGRDRGMREQHLLDLGRRDVLAADAEHVLGAADHAQAAVVGRARRRRRCAASRRA